MGIKQSTSNEESKELVSEEKEQTCKCEEINKIATSDDQRCEQILNNNKKSLNKNDQKIKVMAELL